jgi:hypothetical protein
MKELVRLRMRPSRDRKSFRYMLDYVDRDGRRRQISLGHADKRQAERQRQKEELELRVNVIGYASMRLTHFFRDSLMRTKGQVRATTLKETARSMNDFIACVGDIDVQQVRYEHGERFIQYCLGQEISAATVTKKVKHLKGVFQLAGIETTERFYLAVRTDMVDRARAASEASRKGHSVARLLLAPAESDEIGRQPCASALQTKP